VLSDVRVLRDDAQAGVLVCRDLVVGVFRDEATGEVYETMQEAREVILREHSKVSVLAIVPGYAAKLGTGEGRELGKASLAKLEPHLSSIAIAIESGSLAATLTRTIMNTMSLVTKRRFAWKAFDDVHAASEWLAERLEGGLSPAELVELAARARTADESDIG
jgi:hypothetical protein